MKRFWAMLAAVCVVMCAWANVTSIRQMVSDFDRQSDAQAWVNANQILAALHRVDTAYVEVNFDRRSDIDLVRREVYFNAGDYFYGQGEYSDAIRLVSKALPLYVEADMRADCLNLLSIAYMRTANYEKAAQYAKECYHLDEQTGDPDVMSSSLNTIAGIYIGAGQPAEAEQYILKAIAMAEKADNPARMAVLQGMASEVYHALKDDNKALEYIDRACDIEHRLGRDDKLQVRLAQKASVLLGLRRWVEAERLLQSVIPALRQQGETHSLGIACNKMGMALLSQQRDREAVPYFREAATLFSQMGDLGNEAHAHRGLYEALWSINPDSARAELERFHMLKDSLYSTATAASMARFNAEFENEWLQRENAMQRQRMRGIIIMAIALATLLAVGVWWWMRRRASRREAVLQAIINRLQTADSPASPDGMVSAEPVRAIAQAVRPDDDLSQSDRDFLDRLLGITRNAMQHQGDLSVEALASQMCVTAGHLNRRVKAITGATTQQYVTRVRLEQARHLLVSRPEMAVAEVARQCGFDDSASFSRAFRRTYAQSPSQYRSSL